MQKFFYDTLKSLNGETIAIDNGTYPIDAYDNIAQLLRTSAHKNMKNMMWYIKNLLI